MGAGEVPGFPLGKTGGLIEARIRYVVSLVAIRSFRWVKPAASLKRRGDGRMAEVQELPFPLGKTGGLIEAEGVSPTLAPGRFVSAG